MVKMATVIIFHKRTGANAWIALGMAIYIVILAIYSAAIPCYRKQVCHHDKTAGKACTTSPFHRHINPCQLKKTFAVSQSYVRRNPSKKMAQLKMDHPVALFLTDYSKNPNASRYKKPPAASPPFILLKNSFLC